MTHDYHGMDVEEAAYRVAHDFPGKVPELARRLGRNAGTLGNQLNPNTETHPLSLTTALAISLLTDDPRILEAFAGAIGFGVFRLPSVRGGDEALLDLVLEGSQEVGEFARSLRKALRDDAISKRELKSLDERCRRVMAAFFTLLKRMEEVSRGG